MCSRKYFIFCLVLVLALAQVSAWPTRTKEEIPVVVEEPQIVEVEETSQNPSSEMPSDVLTKFSETSTNLENKVVVLGSGLTELKSDMLSMAAAVEMLVANNRDLQNSLDKALEENKKANGTKYLVDAGMAFGFKDKAVQMGVVGDMGIRFGKNFVSKIGLQYMACDLGKFELPKWSMDNLTVSATIGWEF